MAGRFAELLELCKAQYEFPKASCFPGRTVHSCRFNIKCRHQTTPLQICYSCQLWMQDPFCVRLASTRDPASFVPCVTCRTTGVARAATA